jgi:hypothetical protein
MASVIASFDFHLSLSPIIFSLYRPVAPPSPPPPPRRAVTCNVTSSGLSCLCSCGYGMRNMTCCLHLSVILQVTSNSWAFGCEEEAIHMRHTNLFATFQDASVFQRSHNDWGGIVNTTITIDDVARAFPEFVCNG